MRADAEDEVMPLIKVMRHLLLLHKADIPEPAINVRYWGFAKCPLVTQSGHYAVKHSWPCLAVDVGFLMQNDIQQ